MPTLTQLETIQSIAQKCIELLDLSSSDFDDHVNILRLELGEHALFTQTCDQLVFYQRSLRLNHSWVFARTINSDMKSHKFKAVNTWKLLLLEIKLIAQQAINEYLQAKSTRLGKYIETLQNAFRHKNNVVRRLQMKLQASTRTEEPITTVKALPSTWFSHWF